MCMHSDTRVCRCTCTCMHIHIGTHMCMHWDTRVHAGAHAHRCTLVRAGTYAHRCTHVREGACAHACLHVHTCMQAHIPLGARMHSGYSLCSPLGSVGPSLTLTLEITSILPGVPYCNLMKNSYFLFPHSSAHSSREVLGSRVGWLKVRLSCEMILKHLMGKFPVPSRDQSWRKPRLERWASAFSCGNRCKQ